MPHGQVHISKKKKNIAVFLGVIGFIALFWAVTMVKIANNKAQNPEMKNLVTDQTGTLPEGQTQVE